MADGNEQGKWVNLDENWWTLLSILLFNTFSNWAFVSFVRSVQDDQITFT